MTSRFNRIAISALVVLLLFPCSTQSIGQESVVKVTTASMQDGDNPFVRLTIGSKAPPLNIQHWISDGKGKWPKVTDFEPGKVYLVEFWATWCGPCLQVLPYLVELQSQYTDQGVQFISVSHESLREIQPFLNRSLPSAAKSATLSQNAEAGSEPKTFGDLVANYSLTTDPDQSVSRDYMQAAGQSGIPCGFLIGKTGLIEWIGHPTEAAQPLAEIVAGRWDREQFAKSFKPSQIREAVMGMLDQALRAGDMQQAKAILQSAKKPAAEDPELAAILEEVEFQMKLEPIQRHLEYREFDDALDRLQEIEKTATPAQKMTLAMASVTVYLAKGSFEEATKTIGEVVSSESTNLDTLYGVAVQVAEGNVPKTGYPENLVDAALAAIRKAADRVPNHPQITATMKQLEKMKKQ